ncbi:MAG TPA: hypothetical protein VNX18_05970 [Bryobacteraceae bacterium]|nr:hypothetical protein [Bryobacteraceae bacterium]
MSLFVAEISIILPTIILPAIIAPRRILPLRWLVSLLLLLLGLNTRWRRTV